MNSVLSGYDGISEQEKNKRIAFYEGIEFGIETICLKIPDVDQYVHKIFHCLRWATQSREIVEDICKQIAETRISQNRLIQTVGYRVGSMTVDGRAYAQKNIHQWCQYVSETRGSICQILNIVFALGFRQWEAFTIGDILERLSKKTKGKASKVSELFQTYCELVGTIAKFDNFDKHNLVLWGHENLSMDSIRKVEYYLTLDGKEYAASDVVSSANERKITIALIELLDTIFSFAKASNNPKRYYAKVLIDDFNINGETEPPHMVTEGIFTIVQKTKKKGDKRIVESIQMQCPKPPRVVFLARLDQDWIEDAQQVEQVYLRTLRFKKIPVYDNGKYIGEYRCKGRIDNDAAYFHFKKFEFFPAK